MRNVALALVVSALALSGCEITMEDPWAHEQLAEAVWEAEAEIDWHELELLDAEDMSAVGRELDRHEVAMLVRLADVDRAVVRVHCDDAGRQWLMDDLRAIELRRDRYLEEARAETLIGAMPAMCRGYQDDMHELFDELLDTATSWHCHDW
jgi:hypothetical protein